jgi:hypothetical protein
MNKNCDRKEFIKRSLHFGGSIFAASLFFANCKGKDAKKEANDIPADSCEDFSKLTEKDLGKRKDLGYVKESPIQDKHCNNCNLHLPPANAKNCGGCMLFKGPVYSTGYCTYWAPQT